jgi:chitin synthase
MLVGAFSLAFGLTNDEALIFNAALVGTFIVTCMVAKADNQIRMAELLTVLYAIIMIAVYIGVVLTVTYRTFFHRIPVNLQIIDDGPLSLSAIGIWVTFGSFLLAAVLHPQEFGCFFSIIIYLCTIPSM